jgi:hypothetical protein
VPLSKTKDRDRKCRERARIRLDKQLSPPLTLTPVQPIIDAVSPSVQREGYGKVSPLVTPQIDADGNAIPDYGD